MPKSAPPVVNKIPGVCINHIMIPELDAFAATTQRACTFSALSLFVIVLFVLTPLSQFWTTSLLMKMVALALLGYTVYLNVHQIQFLNKVSQSRPSGELSTQLTINMMSSYLFTLFLVLLMLLLSVKMFR